MLRALTRAGAALPLAAAPRRALRLSRGLSTRFTKDHEYVRVEGATGVIGITDFAQTQLGDVVYVALPEVGATFKKG